MDGDGECRAGVAMGAAAAADFDDGAEAGGALVSEDLSRSAAAAGAAVGLSSSSGGDFLSRRPKYVRSPTVVGGAAAVGSVPAAGGLVTVDVGDAGSATAATAAASADDPARSVLTPRPTSTPQRKMTTDTTVAAMNRNTSCLPFSWISWKPSSWRSDAKSARS